MHDHNWSDDLYKERLNDNRSRMKPKLSQLKIYVVNLSAVAFHAFELSELETIPWKLPSKAAC